MAPPPASRTVTAAVARYGRVAVFMHNGSPFVYELPKGVSASDPYATYEILGAAAQLPACWLKRADVAECLQLAVEEIRDRAALAGL